MIIMYYQAYINTIIPSLKLFVQASRFAFTLRYHHTFIWVYVTLRAGNTSQHGLNFLTIIWHSGHMPNMISFTWFEPDHFLEFQKLSVCQCFENLSLLWAPHHRDSICFIWNWPWKVTRFGTVQIGKHSLCLNICSSSIFVVYKR